MRLLLFIMFLTGISPPALSTQYSAWKGEHTIQPNGATVSLVREEKIFENTLSNCAKNDTCDLKRVIFRKEEYVTPPSDPMDIDIHGTRILLGYKTANVSALLDYVVVQFTRGCMWFSHQSADPNDQKNVTEFGIVREQLGEKMQHVFPVFSVDSVDSDPVYGSGEHDRHYYVQWAKSVPEWIPARQGKLIGEELPTFPFGYITDMPGPAFYSQRLSYATNMSLEYKTCVFKTKDVPVKTNGSDVSTEKAIVCFDWESKFAFNHITQRFEHHKGIHPECKRPFSVREEFYRKHSQEGPTEKKEGEE
jgi:hypothetical protein